MQHGYIKVGSFTPDIKVANCDYNTDRILEAVKAAARDKVKLLVFPELCVTGYTCGDLFLQATLIKSAEENLIRLKNAVSGIEMLIVVGCPLVKKDTLYNCACILYNGEILGVVPKSSLPNYKEFYEKRHFSQAPANLSEIYIGNKAYPFGADLLFTCSELSAFTLAVELCEDLWIPSPPSVRHALAGATVIANLSASDEAVSKINYRRQLVLSQSARLVCGYIFSNCGYGESTTDMIFSGQSLIAEDGNLLAESAPFKNDYIVTEIDVHKMSGERRALNNFIYDESRHQTIYFSMQLEQTELTRKVEMQPFVPDIGLRERCADIIAMQAIGLKKRLDHTKAKTVVLGISGGLDSSLALLVSVKAMDMLGLPRAGVIALTMPGFGTTDKTKSNAQALCEALGVTFREIAISESVKQHFKDIGHNIEDQNVVYENAQARERTQILMDVANQTNGLVIGTGDLSELALGWATYNGDHMSMYGVNASVPKTLVRHLIRYMADTSDNDRLKETLYSILDTPISPELLPAKDGQITQKTEDLIGPYELHDFFLYYGIRWAFPPAKVYRLAKYAFKGKYENAVIRKYMRVFYNRFFIHQFKRSCLPDGPKVGTVTLSPRGDWRMPSDACADSWIREIDTMED